MRLQRTAEGIRCKTTMGIGFVRRGWFAPRDPSADRFNSMILRLNLGSHFADVFLLQARNPENNATHRDVAKIDLRSRFGLD